VLRAYAPYKLRPGLNWDDQKQAFGDTVVNTIAEYAPNIKDIIIEKQVVTPLDLEREWGLSEGNISRRAFPGTTLLSASGRGLGAIPHAYQESLHVRLGDPSRRGNHGRERATGGARDSERHQGSGIGHGGTARHRHHRRRPQRAGHRIYLAKAGYKPLVLERSAQVGGAAITDEFHPGFRCSTLAHSAGPIRPDVVRDMRLEKHGLKFITPK